MPHSSQPDRPPSPGPELANIDLNGDDELMIVKFSFRAGGEKVFYERLKNAIIQRKWILQNAPPAPSPQLDAPRLSTAPESSSPGHSRPSSTPVGIAGLERRGLQSRQTNETVLGNAFEDLEALMASAKQIVALAEKFAVESGATSNTYPTDPLLSESAAALGMVTTKDLLGETSSTLYISELSRNLAEYITDERRGILRSQGGIMGLVDLWAMFNRSRNGVELVSPIDFHKAAELWVELSLPVRLRQFRSGLLVVQRRDRTDERTVNELKAWFESLRLSPPEAAPVWDWSVFGCAVTAQDAAQRFGWSIGVATEELEMAEETGALCREEGIEGLKFWINHLVDDE